MTDFTIERVVIPRHLEHPDAVDFIATAEVRNACEVDGFGTEELAVTPAELLPVWLDQEYEPKQLFAARVDGRVVARGIFETRPSAEGDMAWLAVQVHPQFRHRGIGTALTDHLEAIAAAEHRTQLVVYTVSKAAEGDRLASPTGFGSVPADNSEVRMLLGRGFRLEQVERASRLALPVPAAAIDALVDESQQRAGADYRVHRWTGRTPERWLDDMALLFTRMSTDAPTAGLEEPEDVWTRQRLIDYEDRAEAGPKTSLVSVVEHVPSGRLAGLTELGAPAEVDRAVSQNDTIVLREHRGHRLGMLLKAANIRHLQEAAPGHPSIITFNAEENRHMLDVNEAVGFIPMGYEGAWKKVLAGP
ncbi:GNAT family N-acetyltransferase [Lacisediminihabitans sp. H27-G8]|uniref:GNAT family N-acetyltransferase n=1 Tax=Lacisediminihabitans sp. H27-G8 TaxID=3111909 RepID=UPI0038FCD58A